MYTVIDGKLFKNMLVGAYQLMSQKYDIINQLNVFPVPDGDTGNNMLNTLRSMYSMIGTMDENEPVGIIAEKAASGAIMGARGNSGVILSQIIHGLAKGLHGKKTATCRQMSKAFQYGILYAYRAITTPVEGTILSVARGIAKGTREVIRVEPDFGKILEAAIVAGEEALARTPKQLKILADANVVDAGGQGLVFFLIGCLNGLTGKVADVDVKPMQPVIKRLEAKGEDFSIDYPYCTEFIIMAEREFTEEDEKTFKAYLESIGDSIVCVADDEIVKVHVHTNDPGLAIQKALTYGQLSRMKIDNMREEHEEKLIRDAQKLAKEQKEKKKEAQKEFGFIAVSIGEGLNEIFKELGVDYIIEGGQTMNPSTDDMLNAIDEVNAKHVFIFPNNKNITLAANQAKSLVKDKEVIVIPTKTVPQGITAIINFVPDLSAEENEEVMLEEIKNVKTGQVTYAVRDTHIDDKEIHKDDIMGIGDSGIIAVGTDIAATTKEMLETLVDEDSELISIYYGADVSEEDAEKLTAEIEEKYPSVDVDTHFGGQPIYYYVLAVE